MSGVSMVVLERKPQDKKAVTKRYPDGRTLSLLIVKEKLAKKSMAYRWDWDLDLLEKENEKEEL
jgi:predicted GIY-YIG superfamily endonuclease